MVAESTALAGRIEPDAGGALMPVMSIQQAVARYNAVIEFTSKVFKSGTDYGVIPGTNDKPTLLKPGAEKLCSLFGLTADFEEHKCVEDWDKGLFHYAYKCKLIDRNGRTVGTGIGSCNSREKKYRYRNAERTCPTCGEPAIRRSKYPPQNDRTAPPGWYCHAKAGGCGLNFRHDDEKIMSQQGGKVENNEPFDLINTIQKMAQKRALIAAALVTTNASEYFTQDREELTIDIEPDDDDKQPEAQEPVIKRDKEGNPDLSHEPTFYAELDKIAQARSIPVVTARAFLNWSLKKSGKAFADIDLATRTGFLDKFRKGDLDKAMSAKPAANGNGAAAQPDQPQPTKPAEKPAATKQPEKPKPDPKVEWANFEASMIEVGKGNNVDESRVRKGIHSKLVGYGLVGRGHETTAKQRGEMHNELVEQTGAFSAPT